jgi:hypothetical protein
VVRVGRNALPLFNAGLVGVQDQEKYPPQRHPLERLRQLRRLHPEPILVRDAEALGIYKALGVTSGPRRAQVRTASTS